MNQDFTEKKSIICLKKKIRAEGFTWKKSLCTSSEQKKNSCNLKFPSPTHHFSNGPSTCVMRLRYVYLRYASLHYSYLFPASRGLSRRGKLKREERPLPASNELFDEAADQITGFQNRIV